MTKFSKKAKSQKGFSLIELSIVLIIIGLLVAGITGGASLINSAELRAVISEARGYQIAVNTYFVQKDQLPGDDGGDENGIIEAYNGETVATAANSEGSNAWEDLEVAGVVDFTVATPATINGNFLTLGTDIPKSKSKGNGWTFDYRTTASNAGLASPMNAINLIKPNSSGTAPSLTLNTDVLAYPESATSASLPAEDVVQIDTKVDDAGTVTGKVIANEHGSAVACNTTPANDCSISFSVDI